MDSTTHQWAVRIEVPVTADQARTIHRGQVTVKMPEGATVTKSRVFCEAHGSPLGGECGFPSQAS